MRAQSGRSGRFGRSLLGRSSSLHEGRRAFNFGIKGGGGISWKDLSRSFWDPCCGRYGDESASRARVGSWAAGSAAGELGR